MTEQKISKDMNIGEVVQEHPETAEVFMGYGMHCIGCMAGMFESIEQGAKAHGMDDDKIDKMMEEVNAKLSDQDSADSKDEDREE